MGDSFCPGSKHCEE